MQDLCENLYTFYNTNIIGDQTGEIKDEFRRVSLENLGNGKGKQTLMNLICNHFSEDIKPQPKFIGGPKNLTVHWSDVYKKMIYIFGEIHSEIIDCDYQFDEAKGKEIDTPNAKKMSFGYFLNQFIKTTDKFLDIFIEFPALSNKETRKYHKDFLPLPEQEHMAILFDQFKECVEYPTRGGERCRLARMHYFDIRNKDNDYDGLSDGTDIISYFLIELQYIINNAIRDHLTYDELANVLRNRFNADQNIMRVLNALRESDTEKFQKFWIGPLRVNEYIEKELNKLEKDNPELKQQITDYIDKEIIRRATKIRQEWIKYTSIIFKEVKTKTLHSGYNFYKAVQTILISLHHVYAAVVDAYLLARMFKKFNMNEMKEKAYPGVTDQPDRARNIIIYCRNNHAEIIRSFLKDILMFDDIAISGEREENVKEVFCIDMKTISQPLFVYPTTKIETHIQLDDLSKKSVLVLCQRKEGFTFEINVQDHLIPTLEKIIKAFLREKMGDDTSDIKYMTSLNSEPNNKADFNISLVSSNPKAKEFSQQHSEFYDLIVLQTCPYMYMDFNLIRNILKEGGYVICVAVQINGEKSNLNKQITMGLLEKFNRGFIRSESDQSTLITFQKRTTY